MKAKAPVVGKYTTPSLILLLLGGLFPWGAGFCWGATPSGRTSPGASLGTSPGALFQQANQATLNRNYAKAIRLYQQLIKQGFHSSELYYNAGTVHLLSKDRGRAVLYLARARELSPWSSDIQHNLERARQQVAAELPARLRALPWETARAVLLYLPGRFFVLLVLLLQAALLSLLLLRWWWHRQGRPLRGGLVLGLLFFFWALGLLGWWGNLYLHQGWVRGVVLPQTALLRAGPDKRHPILLALPGGAMLRLLRSSRGWTEVRVAGSLQGWLPQKTVRPLWPLSNSSANQDASSPSPQKREETRQPKSSPPPSPTGFLPQPSFSPPGFLSGKEERRTKVRGLFAPPTTAALQKIALSKNSVVRRNQNRRDQR